MKVIDLINDLFDYRDLQPDKLPKKIRFNNEEFVFKSNSYYNENDINIMAYVNHTLDLRVEVEVLEEDKEIEEIKTLGGFELAKESYDDVELGLKLGYTGVSDTFNEVYFKINEIIRKLNELKKGK